MIAAAIFDMDGLLLDTERRAFEIFNEVAVRFDDAVDLGTYATFVGLPKRDFAKALSQVFAAGVPVNEMAERFYEEVDTRLHTSGPPPKTGAVKIVAELRNRGIGLGVATSTYKQSALRALTDANMLEYFDTMVFGDEVEVGKPAPDIFLEACRRIGVAPEQALVFEDSPRGLKAAHGAGCRPILVPDVAAPSEAEKELAFRCYNSLSDALEDLDALLA